MVNEGIEPTIQDLNLESIVDSEIFTPEKNIFKKAKQTIEKTVFHHKNKVVIPVGVAIGGLGYYFSHKAIEGLNEVIKILNPESSSAGLSAGYGVAMGLGLGYFSYIYLDEKVKNYVGKAVLGVKKGLNNIKKKKESFFYRNRLGLALISTGLAVTYYANLFQGKIQQTPPATREAFNQNIEKIMWGFAPLGLCFLAGTYLAFSLIGGKKPVFENKSMREIKGEFLYKLSKKKGISYLENESREGNIYAENTLALIKDNIDEKLEHEKKVMERIKEQNAKEGNIYYSEEVSFIKNSRLGYHYSHIKGNSTGTLITIAMAIYPSNPKRAVRILNKLSEVKFGKNRTGILSTRNYFLNIHETDRKEDWQELISWLEKEGKMRLLQGSEGRTSSFFDDFTNKNFIFKEYGEDKSDKFFIEREILNILKGSEIKVENPLLYYDEGSTQRQVFIRDGEKNLREYLDDKPITERRAYFESVLPLLASYQQKIFSSLEKEGSEFIMSAEFRGEKRKINIPILDLENNLMRRAFLGSEPNEFRLGKNEYLPDLLNKLKGYKQQNQYDSLLTFNRGDTTSANITETFCIIDPRPCISHPLYDLVYISGDPVFISLSLESRKEKALEVTIKEHLFKHKEEDLCKAFDSLYLNLALCNAGANLYLGKKELTKIIIEDLLEFSKGKLFEKELVNYLKHSNMHS